VLLKVELPFPDCDALPGFFTAFVFDQRAFQVSVNFRKIVVQRGGDSLSATTGSALQSRYTSSNFMLHRQSSLPCPLFYRVLGRQIDIR
jgi:hypothetical protein